MSTAFSSGGIEFGLSFGPSAKLQQRDAEEPFNMLVLADLSGRANRGRREPLAARAVRRVDLDNFEHVFAQSGAALHLPLPAPVGSQSSIRFATLEDFHPDHLLRQIPSLANLHAAWKRLQSPATAARGAEELENMLKPAAPAREPEPPPTAPAESHEATLARLMGGSTKSAPRPAEPSGGSAPVQNLIRSIFDRAGSAPSVPAGSEGLAAAAELELSNQLRTILHQADFQGLEAAWRGIDFLVRRLLDDDRLRLFLLDVSLEELAADLDGLERLLRDRAWALFIGQYTFGLAKDDLTTLAEIARRSAALDTLFLAAGHPQLVGCDDLALHPDPDDWKQPLPPEIREAWQACRRSPGAAHIGLALPRFLLRQPYGTNSDSIEAFPFEELPPEPPHDCFLWGNPALLCALLQAQGFQEEGWNMTVTRGGEVADLPLYMMGTGSGAEPKPFAEVWLSERGAAAVARQGFIPVVSVKNRNAVLLPGLQSVREAPP